jgi:ABC-type branched-subunit amino acid transport system substrate-binding protein
MLKKNGLEAKRGYTKEAAERAKKQSVIRLGLTFVWAAAAVVAAPVLAASAPAAAEGLKLGALLSLSGGLSSYGQASLVGLQLAVDEMNAAGGVNGGKVTLAVGDDRTAPQGGIDAAKKLVETDKVNVLIGALASGVTIPVAINVTVPAGVLQVSTASTSPEITTLKDDDLVFRTVPTDAGQGAALAQIARDKGVKKIAVAHVNNGYGKGLADTFARAYDGAVAAVAYDPKRPGALRGELQQAAKSGAETLLVIAYPDDGIAMLKQALDGGLFKRVALADGMKASEVIAAAGAKALEGAFGTAPQGLGEAAAAFRKVYEAKHKDASPKPYVDAAYDAAVLVGLAALRAKSSEPKMIRDALRAVANPPGEKVLPGAFAKAKKLIESGQDIDYVGAAGPQNFDAAGDVTGSYAHWEIKDGKFVTIKVFEVK